MSGLVSAFVTDDPERDWPVVARHHAYQWDSYWSAGAVGTGEPPPPPVDVERVRRRGLSWRTGSLLFATPEDAAARLRERLAGVPVDTIFLWASIGAMPEDLVSRNVVTILTQLAPLLSMTD